MMPLSVDPKSIAGKPLQVAERTELLVVGAGPAGLAAAIEGAALGRSVMLVDENPVSFETMGEDVPLHFGQRMGLQVRNRNAMLEAMVASDEAIAVAFDAGVDVRLGTQVWGLFANGPTVGWLPEPVAGLYDGERSTIVGFEQVIVAAGRRDIGLAFDGWTSPGVLGVTAAERLLHRYGEGALAVRQAAVIGSTAETLAAVLRLHDRGLAIVGLIEQAAEPVGPPDLVAAVQARGIPILTRHVPRQGHGGADGIEALTVARVDSDLTLVPASEARLACDAVLLGVGAVAAIELLDALGVAMKFDGARGGYVPDTDPRTGRTSLPFVFAAGDAAGLCPGKTQNAEVARAEGRRAARAAAGAPPERADFPSPPAALPYDAERYRLDWIKAATLTAESEPFVCRCEEVTARDILEVRPPRYLAWRPRARDACDLRSLLGEGAPSPDQVKRLTRAGMGPCQGRRCREQVAGLLALGAGVPLREVALASHRAPVRPLPLAAAASLQEAPDLVSHWDSWFGMPSQWVPFWEAPSRYTAAMRDPDAVVASE